MPEERRAPLLRTAAVLTVGTELTEGLRTDTNSGEIAVALSSAGHEVLEVVSLPDDTEAIAAAIGRLLGTYDTVVTTGGLGPTHDDVTREAAALALGIVLAEDPGLRAGLEAAAARHRDSEASGRIFRQAQVLTGAEVIPAVQGTAPGQVVRLGDRVLALLPGPPSEMRPILHTLVERFGGAKAPTAILPCAGVSESDAQITAERALGGEPDVGLTVLAKPAQVEVLLVDRGAGPGTIAAAAARVRTALGDACYVELGATLAEAVLNAARGRGWTLATAESCTGGMVAARITTVPGSSSVFLGGVVSYANSAKRDVLGVSSETLERFGAVSRETAEEMARGARRVLGADVAVSVTGIAGPDGGTPDKPVGLVWFAIDGPAGTHVVSRELFGDRDGIRERATVIALDLLRRYSAGSLPPCRGE